MRSFIIILFANLLTSIVLNISVASSIDALKGPAFTDPKDIMPPKNNEWLTKKINYPSKYQGADIFLTLDQQLYPALLPLINRYGAQNKLNIKVHEGTCGISSGMLSRKEADIGGYCCPPGRTDRINGLEFHTLGISSMAIFVNPANKQLDNIRFEQLQQVFNGDILRWSQLDPNSSNQLIHPVARLHCKLRPGHWRLILDNEERFSTRLNEVSAIPDMISFVADDPNAIGYETLWMTLKYQNKGRVKWLKINGYSPDDNRALAKGLYPIYRTFNVTTWQPKQVQSNQAQKLVDFLIANASQVKSEFALVPVQELRKQGWKFYRNELIGQPNKK